VAASLRAAFYYAYRFDWIGGRTSGPSIGLILRLSLPAQTVTSRPRLIVSFLFGPKIAATLSPPRFIHNKASADTQIICGYLIRLRIHFPVIIADFTVFTLAISFGATFPDLR